MNPYKAVLDSLPFTPLRVSLRMLDAWSGSEFKGSRLRGGLGTFLRQNSCTTGRSECRGCPELGGCAYGILFETPVQPETFRLLRLYEKAPHAFVLAAPSDRRRSIPAGDTLQFGLAPIGLAHEALPLFAQAFDQMGASGDYGGRFRLDAIHSALHPDCPVFSAKQGWHPQRPPQWTPPPEPSGDISLRLNFHWPLRLIVNRDICQTPQFIDIVRGLLRRLHVLASLYGGLTEPFEILHPLLDLARTARHLDVVWSHAPLERHSLRQHKTLPLDGVTGGLVVQGRLGPLLPFLEAGRWLHIGKGSSLGLGGFDLEVKPNGNRQPRGTTARDPHLARAVGNAGGTY